MSLFSLHYLVLHYKILSRPIICQTIFRSDKIQIQNAPSVGSCQRMLPLSTASALIEIFHSSKYCLASDKQEAENKNTGSWPAEVLTGCCSLFQFTRPRMEECDGAVDHDVWPSFILLFPCRRWQASPPQRHPAGPVSAPSPSPAARHSRSPATLRGWTGENLENVTGAEWGEIRAQREDFKGMRLPLCCAMSICWTADNPVNDLSISQRSVVRILSFYLKKKATKTTLKSYDPWRTAPLEMLLLLMSVCVVLAFTGTDRIALVLFYIICPLLFPTFENQPPAHQFGKLQIVEGENVVEDDGPEVGSIEHTADPARHSLTHNPLEPEDTGIHVEIPWTIKCKKGLHDYLFPTAKSVSVLIFLTSMVEKGGRENNLATHSSKLRPKQLKKDQM